jgi:hypothetical protein
MKKLVGYNRRYALRFISTLSLRLCMQLLEMELLAEQDMGSLNRQLKHADDELESFLSRHK